MHTRPAQQSFTNHRRQNRFCRAFNLTELLTVIGVLVVLTAVLSSVAFTNRKQAQLAQCANNMRQTGIGLSLYAAEENGCVPICGWSQGQNPWQTYEACRVSPGTTTVTRGFYSLGLLFRTKNIPNLKIFYCPSQAQISPIYSYEYYVTSGNWPSTPAGSFDDNIRTAYNYYPQLRVTENLATSYGSMILPRLTYSTVGMEFGGTLKLVTPAKLSELDPKKSIASDLVNATSQLSHRASGSVAGLNALFPDGHVTFQLVRGHDQQGSHQPFDPLLWNSGPGPANDPAAFRIIMNGWTP